MWLQTRPCRSRRCVQVKWTPNAKKATAFKGCHWDVSEILICLFFGEDYCSPIQALKLNMGVFFFYPFNSFLWGLWWQQAEKVIPVFSIHNHRFQLLCWRSQAKGFRICPMVPIQLDLLDTSPNQGASQPPYLLWGCPRLSGSSIFNGKQVYQHCGGTAFPYIYYLNT